MVADRPEDQHSPATSLFCWADGRCEIVPTVRPAISTKVRETFAAYFAADFAAAMTEHYHDIETKAA